MQGFIAKLGFEADTMAPQYRTNLVIIHSRISWRIIIRWKMIVPKKMNEVDQIQVLSDVLAVHPVAVSDADASRKSKARYLFGNYGIARDVQEKKLI